jgi:hypothetical protein
MTAEGNAHRTRWADSPIWSVVNGPWRLKTYTEEGIVTFVPNSAYSGPNPARLDEFRQIPTSSDEEEYELLKSGDSIQVGFLPPALGVQPDDDPTAGGPNPLGDRYNLVPQILFNVRYMQMNFTNSTIAGALIRQAYASPLQPPRERRCTKRTLPPKQSLFESPQPMKFYQQPKTCRRSQTPEATVLIPGPLAQQLF